MLTCEASEGYPCENALAIGLWVFYLMSPHRASLLDCEFWGTYCRTRKDQSGAVPAPLGASGSRSSMAPTSSGVISRSSCRTWLRPLAMASATSLVGASGNPLVRPFVDDPVYGVLLGGLEKGFETHGEQLLAGGQPGFAARSVDDEVVGEGDISRVCGVGGVVDEGGNRADGCRHFGGDQF